jgi:hypothetical protein
MVDGDYMSLVKTRPVAQWRETLAVLATYTGSDQWASLCDALASRLGQTGMAHAASLCYICAGNVDQVRADCICSYACSEQATLVHTLGCEPVLYQRKHSLSAEGRQEVYSVRAVRCSGKQAGVDRHGACSTPVLNLRGQRVMS